MTDPVAAFWEAHRNGVPVELTTSGTSGSPRTIVRTTASWVDSFPLVARRLDLTSSDRFWIPGPLASTMNLFAACLAQWAGCTWSPEREGATLWQVTPTGLAQHLEQGSGVTALVAGDGLHPGLRDTALSAGMRVHHYYGAAEMSLVAWGTASDDLQLFDRVEAEVRASELWVRSPWLAAGVRGDTGPYRTDDRGFVTVGDRASLTPDGRLSVLGRPGFVTTAGETVSLAEIETLLRPLAPGGVHLIGAPHGTLGEVLTCVVECPDDLDAVRGFARTHLHGARRPRRYVVQRVRRTSAGKPDLRTLAETLR